MLTSRQEQPGKVHWKPVAFAYCACCPKVQQLCAQNPADVIIDLNELGWALVVNWQVVVCPDCVAEGKARGVNPMQEPPQKGWRDYDNGENA